MRKLTKRQELLFECLTKKNAEGKLNKKKTYEIKLPITQPRQKQPKCETYLCVRKQKQTKKQYDCTAYIAMERTGGFLEVETI